MTDVFGPIDFTLVEFPGEALDDGVAAAAIDLVDRGTIRLYDVMAIKKDAAGVVRELALDGGGPEVGAFAALAGARSGLLSGDDLAEAGAAMDAGTVAVLLVYENTWAVPFVAAALQAKGQMIASARIPAQDVMDVLDELESTS